MSFVALEFSAAPAFAAPYAMPTVAITTMLKSFVVILPPASAATMESTSATAMEPTASTVEASAAETTAAEAAGAAHAGESVIALHARHAAILDSAKSAMAALRPGRDEKPLSARPASERPPSTPRDPSAPRNDWVPRKPAVPRNPAAPPNRPATARFG